MAMRGFYRDIVLTVIPRILSSIDTNPLSKTYGCIDKNYWFYKTTDFPGSRFQEAMLSLALLYKTKFQGNIYYKNEKIRRLAIAALNFWLKSIKEKGSVDEWYPNEHSLCATAFGLYAATETYLQLNLTDNGIIKKFLKSAQFLSKSEKVANQEIGSITALYNVYILTNHKNIKKIINKKLIYLYQNDEGWFDEYNGPDFGYQTLSIEFLAKYYQKSKDKMALLMINKAIEFLKYFVHPDGSIAKIGSRNTELFFPYGFEVMNSNTSNFIAEICHKNIKDNLNPSKMDDRYSFPYHISYLQSINFNNKKYKKPEIETKHFKQAGLFVYNKNYHLIVNLKKGIFTIFNSHRKDDYGYFAKYKNKIITTQEKNSYEINNNRIIIKGKFKEIFSLQQLTPSKNILLRILLLLNINIKHLLRKKMILNLKETNLKFKRTIILKEKGIEVMDELPKLKFYNEDIKAIYVPTSCFHSNLSNLT